MPWGHTRCPIVTGWQERIATKLAAAGGTGVVMGGIQAIVHQQPFPRHTASVAVSFMLCMGCFSVLQELSRLVRCEDSAANSIMAGATTGYLVAGITSGKRAAPPAAVAFAAVAGLAHLAADKLEYSGSLRDMLIAMDLLDDDETQREARRANQAVLEARRPAANDDSAPSWWQRVLPIRRMSDEEWAAHKQKEKDDFHKRVEVTLEGGLPVLLEKRRKQAGAEREPDSDHQ